MSDKLKSALTGAKAKAVAIGSVVTVGLLSATQAFAAASGSYLNGINLGNPAVAASAVGDYGITPTQATFQANLGWIGFFIGIVIFLGIAYWFMRRAGNLGHSSKR